MFEGIFCKGEPTEAKESKIYPGSSPRESFEFEICIDHDRGYAMHGRCSACRKWLKLRRGDESCHLWEMPSRLDSEAETWFGKCDACRRLLGLPRHRAATPLGEDDEFGRDEETYSEGPCTCQACLEWLARGKGPWRASYERELAALRHRSSRELLPHGKERWAATYYPSRNPIRRRRRMRRNRK